MSDAESIIGVLFILVFAMVVSFLLGSSAGEAKVLNRADRALCESRGGVWLTAPVEPGCYRIEEINETR